MTRPEPFPNDLILGDCLDAHAEGRRWIGIERDAEYHARAMEALRLDEREEMGDPSPAMSAR